MIQSKDIKYILPITLDMNGGGDKSGDSLARLNAFNEKMFLLNDAIMNFKNAASMNENYYEANINSSVAHYLKFVVKNKEKSFSKFIFDDLNFALTAALNAKQIVLNNEPINKKSLADVYTQMAILYNELGMPNQSIRFINQALKELPTSFVAQSNKSLLKGEGKISDLLHRQSMSPFKKCRDKESVNGGSTIDELLIDADENGLWDMQAVIKRHVIFRSLEKVTSIRFHEAENFFLYNITQTVDTVQNKYDLSFYVPKKPLTETSICGISSQSDTIDIRTNYGVESKSIETANSSILRFIDDFERDNGVNYYDGILFMINGLQKVDKWVAFQIAKIEN
jgi:tetratricopeptide (TPR) repeat protein